MTRVRVMMIFWFIASLSIMIETTRLNLQSYGLSSSYQADNSQRSGSMIVHENKEDVPPWTISANSSSDLAAASGQENKKLFSHFFSHIPKSGSSYAFNVLNQIIWPSPEWQALEPKDKFRACNEATKSLRNFHRFRVEYKGTACTMWMTEQKYSDVPNHVYARSTGTRFYTRPKRACLVNVLSLRQITRPQSVSPPNALTRRMVASMGRRKRKHYVWE